VHSNLLGAHFQPLSVTGHIWHTRPSSPHVIIIKSLILAFNLWNIFSAKCIFSQLLNTQSKIKTLAE